MTNDTEVKPFNLVPFETVKPNTPVEITFLSDEGELVTQEGKMQATIASRGVMFRKRGVQRGDLIPSDKVVNMTILPSVAKPVTQQKMQAVTLDSARKHLAVYHGYQLSVVNGTKENPTTPEQAFLAHSGIDHSDLGHIHEA